MGMSPIFTHITECCPTRKYFLKGPKAEHTIHHMEFDSLKMLVTLSPQYAPDLITHAKI